MLLLLLLLLPLLLLRPQQPQGFKQVWPAAQSCAVSLWLGCVRGRVYRTSEQTGHRVFLWQAACMHSSSMCCC